jgi:hypothetical protein
MPCKTAATHLPPLWQHHQQQRGQALWQHLRLLLCVQAPLLRTVQQ